MRELVVSVTKVERSAPVAVVFVIVTIPFDWLIPIPTPAVRAVTAVDKKPTVPRPCTVDARLNVDTKFEGTTAVTFALDK